MKINCVVVTYNRKDLLKENIEALLSQTYRLNKIFIIDNNSNDGTEEFLKSYSNNSHIVVIRLNENIGGAGGFSYGIKEAIIDGGEWVWVMDDDTIPNADSLERLIPATNLYDNVGFVSSKVVWKDGSFNKMNIQGFKNKEYKYINKQSENYPYYLVNNATFVSTMVKADVVKKVGLPIKEFFIWHDDIEFTERIYKNGYLGVYVDISVVLHKTAENYSPHLDTAPVNVAWKFYYQIRNTIYVKRMYAHNKFSYWLSIINKYRRCLRKINKRTDDNKDIFRQQIKRGFIDGIKFRPHIEYID